MSYKEELDRIKEALDYALFGCSDDNANTEKHFNTLQNALIAVDRIKKSQSNLLDQKIDEELKRLKEEKDKLVNSVGEWSALAIDRKQDLDEANKKIEELKEGIDEILDLYHGDGVINQTWILIHLKELKKSLTK